MPRSGLALAVMLPFIAVGGIVLGVAYGLRVYVRLAVGLCEALAGRETADRR